MAQYSKSGNWYSASSIQPIDLIQVFPVVSFIVPCIFSLLWSGAILAFLCMRILTVLKSLGQLFCGMLLGLACCFLVIRWFWQEHCRSDAVFAMCHFSASRQGLGDYSTHGNVPSEQLQPIFWNLWTLHNLAKGTSQIWLSEGFWDGKIILEYLDGPNSVTGVLINKEGGRGVREGDVMKETEVWMMLDLEPKNVGRKPLEAGKGNGTDGPLELPERM